MLAPRKTLWSTPLSAVDHCMERIPLNSNDFVCDIGCGDGRIIHRWAVLVSESASSSNDGGDSQKESSNEETTSFLGIDIDPDRIEAAKRKTDLLRSDGKILPEIKITFLCRNAMESAELFRDATVIFLYLIPRGLKQIYPLIVGERHKLVSKEKKKKPSYRKLYVETSGSHPRRKSPVQGGASKGSRMAAIFLSNKRRR
mmetsp:Transcript_31061/g.65094  ORF Transcript_31061/g.65094 Transcript_31061/m.65094 type:complete len:200 (+) Transcript_31061:257-856(+)